MSTAEHDEWSRGVSTVGSGVEVAPEKSPEMRQGPTKTGGPLSESLSGGVLLSHTLSGAVPSALEGLASGFGMGPGVSPPLWPP